MKPQLPASLTPFAVRVATSLLTALLCLSMACGKAEHEKPAGKQQLAFDAPVPLFIADGPAPGYVKWGYRGGAPKAAALEDVDGDGKPEYLEIYERFYYYPSSGGSVPAECRLYIVHEPGTPQARLEQQPLGTACTCAAFGQVDGAGGLDIVLVDDLGHSALLLNQGQGHFTQLPLPGVGGTLGGSRTARLVDWEQDGLDDLFVETGSLSANLLFRNSGSGGFRVPAENLPKVNPPLWRVTIDPTRGPEWVGVQEPSTSTGSISAIDASGNVRSLMQGPHFWSFVPADIEGDGDTDIAAAVWGTAAAMLGINDGAGTLEAVTHDSGEQAYRTQVALGDLDGDGIPELISGAPLAIYPGAGGSFGEGIRPEVDAGDSGLFSLHLADIDLDGRTDIVVRTTTELVVLHNQSL